MKVFVFAPFFWRILTHMQQVFVFCFCNMRAAWHLFCPLFPHGGQGSGFPHPQLSVKEAERPLRGPTSWRSRPKKVPFPRSGFQSGGEAASWSSRFFRLPGGGKNCQGFPSKERDPSCCAIVPLFLSKRFLGEETMRSHMKKPHPPPPPSPPPLPPPPPNFDSHGPDFPNPQLAEPKKRWADSVLLHGWPVRCRRRLRDGSAPGLPPGRCEAAPTGRHMDR